MKLKTSLFGIMALFAMHTLVLSAAEGPSGEVRAALKHVGGNHTELETALRAVMGKDTEYLISHASQYDLVNLFDGVIRWGQSLEISIRTVSCSFK